MRRCLRDLIAFTSLPLVWKDKTPREIADDLASVLQSTLGSEFVLVRITGPFAEEPIDAARAPATMSPETTLSVEQPISRFGRAPLLAR